MWGVWLSRASKESKASARKWKGPRHHFERKDQMGSAKPTHEFTTPWNRWIQLDYKAIVRDSGRNCFKNQRHRWTQSSLPTCRKDVSKPEGPSKGSVDRPKATADDLRGLERFRSSRSPEPRERRRREPPARRDSRGRHRDSRSAHRSSRRAPRNERARRDSRRPPPQERSDSRRSQLDYAQRNPSPAPRRKRLEFGWSWLDI